MYLLTIIVVKKNGSYRCLLKLCENCHRTVRDTIEIITTVHVTDEKLKDITFDKTFLFRIRI